MEIRVRHDNSSCGRWSCSCAKSKIHLSIPFAWTSLFFPTSVDTAVRSILILHHYLEWWTCSSKQWSSLNRAASSLPPSVSSCLLWRRLRGLLQEAFSRITRDFPSMHVPLIRDDVTYEYAPTLHCHDIYLNFIWPAWHSEGQRGCEWRVQLTVALPNEEQAAWRLNDLINVDKGQTIWIIPNKEHLPASLIFSSTSGDRSKPIEAKSYLWRITYFLQFPWVQLAEYKTQT